MDNDPPPPYSSIDESKGAGYQPHTFYPTPGPPLPPSNQYGATSYPAAAAAAYHGTTPVGPVVYPPTGEPQPRLIIAPVGFARFGRVNTLRQRYSTYGTHILLSCFVICCCGPGGFMCGVVAFCVAICAQSFAESSPQLSRQLGAASIALSLAGVAVTLLMVVLIAANGGVHHHVNTTATTNSTLDDANCLYMLRNRCFSSRDRVRSKYSCYDGYYWNHYCYRN